MRSWWFVLLATGLGAAGPNEEATRYQVSWPSGLSLGDGQLLSTKDGDKWKFTLKLEAAIPGFKVQDVFHSTVDRNLCSVDLVKESTHGTRKAKETSTYTHPTGTRITSHGGLPVSIDVLSRNANVVAGAEIFSDDVFFPGGILVPLNSVLVGENDVWFLVAVDICNRDPVTDLNFSVDILCLEDRLWWHPKSVCDQQERKRDWVDWDFLHGAE